MSKVKYPKSIREYNAIRNSDRVICVMFAKKDHESSDGILCLIDGLSTQCKKICFVYVDLDHGTFSKHPEALDVKVVPTFKIYKNRNLSSKVLGSNKAKVYENVIKLAYDKNLRRSPAAIRAAIDALCPPSQQSPPPSPMQTPPHSPYNNP